MSDEPGAPCPECGEPAERQISAGGGFLFKGEGFYITDHRSEDYKKKASAEQGGTSKESPKAEPAKPAKEGGSSEGTSSPKTSAGD